MMNTTINDNTTKLASKAKLDNDVCPEVNIFHDSDDMESFLEQHMLHSTDASSKQTFPMHKDSMPSFSEQHSFIILMLILNNKLYFETVKMCLTQKVSQLITLSSLKGARRII